MDEVERQRFLETLRSDEQFRSAVRRELELEQLHELPGQIVHLTNAVNALVDDQAELRRAVLALVDDQAELRRTVLTLVRNQQELQDNLRELIGLVGQSLRSTSEGFERFDQRLGGLEEKVGGLEEKVGGLEEKVGGLEEKVDRGFTRTSAHFDQVHAALVELRNDLGR